MASHMTEWGFLGNLAQLRPGEVLDCAKMAGEEKKEVRS